MHTHILKKFNHKQNLCARSDRCRSESKRPQSRVEQILVRTVYDFGWQSREIAVDLRVNESRISQIKQRAISMLRLQLEVVSTRRPA